MARIQELTPRRAQNILNTWEKQNKTMYEHYRDILETHDLLDENGKIKTNLTEAEQKEYNKVKGSIKSHTQYKEEVRKRTNEIYSKDEMKENHITYKEEMELSIEYSSTVDALFNSGLASEQAKAIYDAVDTFKNRQDAIDYLNKELGIVAKNNSGNIISTEGIF